MKIRTFFLTMLALMLGIGKGSTCSRVVFHGRDSLIVVGRTLDWRSPIPTNIYVYPRGMRKRGMPQGKTLEWVSKYGSVLAVSYDGGTTEGMNEKGLVMNALFCKGTLYRNDAGGDAATISLAVFINYFLDNFASVAEAETWLNANDFAIYGENFDGSTEASLHWALTDRTGTTLVIEYRNRQLELYKSENYDVLTNDPPFSDMLAIDGYWKQIGGSVMLPGTVHSPDRFVRASFFISHIPADVDAQRAAAAVVSVLGVVSVPLGYELPDAPNLSSTQWHSVSDALNLRYYFGFTTEFCNFWIDLSEVDLNAGAPVLKLDTADRRGLAGCVHDRLEISTPFNPMW